MQAEILTETSPLCAIDARSSYTLETLPPSEITVCWQNGLP